jgi:hypothetical protein
MVNKRKRNKQTNKQPQLPNAGGSSIKSDVPASTASTASGPREADDIQATFRTLSALLVNPSLLRSSNFKLIRKQLYTLLRSLSLSSALSTKTYSTAQLANLTSEAFEAERWTDALVSLDALEELGHRPKLGSIQRWISKSGDTWGTPMGTALIDAIIRSTGTMPYSPNGRRIFYINMYASFI